MDTPVSSSLRITFLIHSLVALVLGAAVFLIPGRTLTMLNWVPSEVQIRVGMILPGTKLVDPVTTRILGAALLALAYSSFQGWRAIRHEQVRLLVQLEFIFCVLGAIAVLAGLVTLQRPMPLIGWALAAILVVFAVLWGLALRR